MKLRLTKSSLFITFLFLLSASVNYGQVRMLDSIEKHGYNIISVSELYNIKFGNVTFEELTSTKGDIQKTNHLFNKNLSNRTYSQPDPGILFFNDQLSLSYEDRSDNGFKDLVRIYVKNSSLPVVINGTSVSIGDYITKLPEVKTISTKSTKIALYTFSNSDGSGLAITADSRNNIITQIEYIQHY